MPTPDSNYPAALDNYVALNASEVQPDLNNKSAHVRKALAAVTAIEAALGINPQGAEADVVTRLDGIDAAIAALAPATYLLTTTDDVYTPIFTKAVPDESVTIFRCKLVAKYVSGSGGTPDQQGAATIDIMLRRHSGSMNITTMTSVAYLDVGWQINPADGGGGNFQIQVRAALDCVVNWKMELTEMALP